jgi:iron(III) transport system ATP-binding protein
VGVLTIQGLVKRFGEVTALAGVDLEVQAGEFFTLLGPSGCGKTTLLRSLAGFETPDAGEIRLGDESLLILPAHARGVGMVFQSYAVFPHLSVFENVAFGLRARGAANDEVTRRVEAMLARVRLEGYGERTPDQLSGGQQQRVGLARAMAIHPRLLLMDEPLSNLDAKLRVEMRGEIKALQRELGTTTVYVTHDQEEALAVSDRIAVFDQGHVQQVGTPWEVYKQPANLFVASFVGRANSLAEPLVARLRELREIPAGAAVALRPEDVAFGAGDGVQLEGTLRAAEFTGTVVTYRVDCGELGELLVEGHRPGADDLRQPGAAVTLSVDPAAAHVFPQ